jgi:hypothetical protein
MEDILVSTQIVRTRAMILDTYILYKTIFAILKRTGK